MTPSDFLSALADIGWTKRHMTKVLHCDTNLPTRWGRGDVAIPPAIAEWLTHLAQAHRRHPPPGAWRKRSTTDNPR